MKRAITILGFLSVATAAHAADPVMLDPIIEPAAYTANWTGVFIGGQVGWLRGPKFPRVPTVPTNPGGPGTTAECDDFDLFAFAHASTPNTSATALALPCAAFAIGETPNTEAAALAVEDWNERFDLGDQDGVTASDLSFFYDEKRSTIIGGVHVGYNHQFQNNFVLGALADVNFLDWERRMGITDGDNILGVSQSVNFLGTLRARAGFAADRVLFYATGGLAVGGVESKAFQNNTVLSSDRDTRFGYTIGGGLEFLAADNFSIGAEYLHTDLENDNDNLKFNSVFLRLSYHFR